MYAWEQIQKTLDYIETHLGEEITIEELSEIASLSPFYYQRLFRRLVKKPAGEYIKLRRLAKSADILLQSDSRILDIALELGFTSQEHFTRIFKENFGMTPGAYRKCPKALNRMTKPELSFQYTLIEEGVPLAAEGIVLEIRRKVQERSQLYIGLEKEMPVGYVEGLGVESGVDPLHELWCTFHEKKDAVKELDSEGEEAGITHPCSKEGFFSYFAGAAAKSTAVPEGYQSWEMPKGEYIVCSFEAENFELLVMDALYKAQQYLYGTWLPENHLVTEPFCAERYAAHGTGTTSMEVWLKLLDKN